MNPPERRWCCAWTRNRRFRRSTAPHRACRSCRPPRPGTATTTSATAPPVCSPRSTSPPARSSPPHHRPPPPEFKKFLKTIDADVPAGLDVHLISITTPPTRPRRSSSWLIRHPRFELHFIPNSSSWLNLVERWFAELTNRNSAAPPTRSVDELEADIRAWIDAWNDNPTALRLDQDRRRDPRKHRQISSAD